MDKLLASLTSKQVTEWLAFAELEPFGPLAEDTRAGVIAALVANTAFGRKKGARTYAPEDFFKSLRKPSRRQSWQAMAATLRAFTIAKGGRVASRAEREKTAEADAKRAKAAMEALKAQKPQKPEPKGRRRGKKG